MDSHQTVAKITHIITGLGVGGAEIMLYNLLSHTDRSRFAPEVISLLEPGPVGRKIEALGIRVRSLGMDRGIPNPLQVLRLARWLKEQSPDLVQTWMYHANLIGGLAAKCARNIPVIWGIHHSTLDSVVTKPRTRYVVKISAPLSRLLPARVVCCSETSRATHSELGYDPDKMVMIPNGFDLVSFRPDPLARTSLCRELALPDHTPLIGLVARFHPLKDHQTFLRAAAYLHRELPDARFILCGEGVDWQNSELAQWVRQAGLEKACYLLGRRNDMPRITTALDVASSSSIAEAFPLVVGEAMACGVPCVVTDVGDSAIIVGDTGVVVPPRNPHALAEGWHNMLELPAEQRSSLGARARQRILENYSLAHVVGEYEALYEAVLASTRKPRSALPGRIR